MKTRKIGLESPISFADLLESSQEPSILHSSPPDLRSDDTETNELSHSEEEEDEDENDNDIDDDDDESVTEPVTLSMATSKNLLQVSDIDESYLNRTMDAFCNNLKQSVQEQFVTSRTRLMRQTENEINSITKVYQDSLTNKERELEQMRMEKDAISKKYTELNMDYQILQTSYAETKKKLSCVRQLSQTVMKWKNDCDKKRFIANYVNNKILPNKQRTKLQNIFYFWKNRALSMHYGRYDEIWQKRLETVSKKIIEQYEINISELREELSSKSYELHSLQTERNQQQQDMKRAFMRGVSALNLEAMSLFNHSTQQLQNENSSKESNKQAIIKKEEEQIIDI